MSGSSGNIYAPQTSQLQNQAGNYTNLANQNVGAVSGYSPYVSSQTQSILQQYLNNPYASQAQSGANAAAQYGTNTVAPAQQAAASALQGLGGQYSGDVGQALSSGFSANNGLYNQQYGRTLDQANAINAMNGVAGTPYGAGLTDQAAQNFNNNWNLNQAALQSQAANTAANLGNAANSAYSGASNLGTSAINTMAGSAALPSQNYTSNLANDLSALSGGNTAIGGATGDTNSVLNSLLSYLQYGNQAQTGNQQLANQSLSGLGSLLGMGLSFL